MYFAAYLISAPKNEEKALEVYKKVHKKNLAVKDVAESFNIEHIKGKDGKSLEYMNKIEKASEALVSDVKSKYGDSNEIYDILKGALRHFNKVEGKGRTNKNNLES